MRPQPWNAHPFEYYVMEEPNSGCHIWIGARSTNGYGRVTYNNPKPRYTKAAHRVAYESVHGPIQEGLDLDHLCRMRCCVNPAKAPDSKSEVRPLPSRKPAVVGSRPALSAECYSGDPML
jgi:HNH endonuclease